MQDVSTTLVAVLVKGGAHHLDLRYILKIFVGTWKKWSPLKQRFIFLEVYIYGNGAANVDRLSREICLFRLPFCARALRRFNYATKRAELNARKKVQFSCDQINPV